MDIIGFRDFCLSLPHTEEATPFDETTLVYKVGGKMYTLTDMDEFEYVLVKCDPDKAIELRERYPEVTPGYHMNKRHWNGVSVTGDLPDSRIKEWVRESYDMIVASLPRKVRDELFPHEHQEH